MCYCTELIRPGRKKQFYTFQSNYCFTYFHFLTPLGLLVLAPLRKNPHNTQKRLRVATCRKNFLPSLVFFFRIKRAGMAKKRSAVVGVLAWLCSLASPTTV
jgi:hypothetical protein